MPLELETDQQPAVNEDDLMRLAMRGGMPMRTGESTASGPMPQPNGAPTPGKDAAMGDDADLYRMATGAPKSAVPAAAVAPDPNAPPKVALPAGDGSMINSALDRSTQMPAAAPNGIRLGELIKQRAQAGQPIDRNDPKYKMGIGGRLLTGAADLLSGGVPGLLRSAVDHNAPGYIGKGAVNNKYYQDTNTQQATTKNLDTEIGDTDKLNKENESLYRDAIRQGYESQVGQARQGTAAAQKEVAEARGKLADTQKEKADTAAAARDISYDPKSKRFMQGNRVYVPKTIEEGASLEAANGIDGRYSKMWGNERKNSPAPDRQPTDLSMWADAFKKDNGRAPTADEIAQRKVIAKGNGANAGRVSNAQKDKETELAQAEKQFEKDWNQAYKDETKPDAGTLEEIKARHEQNKQRIQKTFEDRMAVLDPDGSLQAGKGSQPNKKAAPAPAVQPAAAPPPVSQPKPQGTPQRKVGDIVPTKNGNMKITKILPNGKYEGTPSS